MSTLVSAVEGIAAAEDVDAVVSLMTDGAHDLLGAERTLLLLRDETRPVLYTVASKGYERVGAGAEVPLGQGIIGVAAANARTLRFSNLQAELRYLKAASPSAPDPAAETNIELPALAQAQSAIATPLRSGDELIGVVAVESPRMGAFGEDAEHALRTIAAVAAQRMLLIRATTGGDVEVSPGHAPPSGTATIRVRFSGHDDSVFVGDEYVIKGVAGRILRFLVREHIQHGRTEFSNRELRADGSLGLPAYRDNLESRLLLLRRRLEDQDVGLRIRKAGRGRFGLETDGVLELSEQ